MTKRIERLVKEIPDCNVFADIGCDHGYVSEFMLENNKCKRAIISDISEKSLKKAEKLLKKYIDRGVCLAFVADGLKGLPHDIDTALIAGMGGEEIIKILRESEFLPENLVLQPMKNTDKLRRELFKLNYGIVCDFVFKDGKFYNVLRAEKSAKVAPYTDAEYEFGRDNLKNRSEDFIAYVKNELKNAEKYEKAVVSLCDMAYFNNRITLLKEVLNEN